jgi:hypothetical protein
MQRSRIETYQGKDIVIVDLSGLTPEDMPIFNDTLDKTKRLVSSKPLGSVLTLTITTNFRFDKHLIAGLNDLTTHDRPFVKRAAITGVEGLQRVVLRTVSAFSKRKIEIFDTKEDAFRWLVAEKA